MDGMPAKRYATAARRALGLAALIAGCSRIGYHHSVDGKPATDAGFEGSAGGDLVLANEMGPDGSHDGLLDGMADLAGDLGIGRLVVSGGYDVDGYQAMPAIVGRLVINTNSCQGVDTVNGIYVAGVVQDSACVVGLARFEVPTQGRVEATGARPLVLVVRDQVTIGGLVDVGARGATPGPGGALGGQGVGASGEGAGGGSTCTCADSEGECGGGGGGYGEPGGRGGPSPPGCASLSLGGLAHGQPFALIGGSGGAAGGYGEGLPVGGAGGGALQVSSHGPLVVDGAISAGGGGGAAAADEWGQGGGGGGSGGSVLLEAPTISGAGLVAANGGAGGSGGEYECERTAGADGEPSWDPAIGGVGDAQGTCGRGGDGGTGVISPGDGAPGQEGGGGGGGAAGRIHFVWRDHQAMPPLQSSGLYSTGEAVFE
jgi:hypothetical protein